MTLSASGDLVLLVVSAAAGLLGALGGVGGGLIIVPVLTLVFGVDIHVAAGASIVSVIATSSGAAVAFLRDGWANIRIAMFLQIATVIGAIVGALVAPDVPAQILLLTLGIVLLISVAMQVARLNDEPGAEAPAASPDPLRLGGEYFSLRLQRQIDYRPTRVSAGFAMMAVAGVISGLLGIGSGALKVLAMDGLMRLPMKVSSATSNFMIGVTAAASVGIYVARGYVDARLVAPVTLGILVGAVVGARLLPRLTNRHVRLVFVPVLLAIALETLLRGLGVNV
ncbi:MAG TPA: sulfite exporter TauE/SafE family protein [Candidatus Limnocylindrales bacterium]